MEHTLGRHFVFVHSTLHLIRMQLQYTISAACANNIRRRCCAGIFVRILIAYYDVEVCVLARQRYCSVHMHLINIPGYK